MYKFKFKRRARMKQQKRGKNIEFLHAMVFIFYKNWKVKIDKAKIDSKLSYSENFRILQEYYIKGKSDYNYD